MAWSRGPSLRVSGPFMLTVLATVFMYLWFSSKHGNSYHINSYHDNRYHDNIEDMLGTHPPAQEPVDEEAIGELQKSKCGNMLDTPRGRHLIHDYENKLRRFVKKKMIHEYPADVDREKERELLKILVAKLPGIKNICITPVEPLQDLYVWFLTNNNSVIYLVGSSEIEIKEVVAKVLHSQFAKRVRVPMYAISKFGFQNIRPNCDLIVISEYTDKTVWKNLKALQKIASRRRSYIIFQGYTKGTHLSRVWDEAKKSREVSELLRCSQRGNKYDIIGKIEWDRKKWINMAP